MRQSTRRLAPLQQGYNRRFYGENRPMAKKNEPKRPRGIKGPFRGKILREPEPEEYEPPDFAAAGMTGPESKEVMLARIRANKKKTDERSERAHKAWETRRQKGGIYS